jgi:hypothetical protein
MGSHRGSPLGTPSSGIGQCLELAQGYTRLSAMRDGRGCTPFTRVLRALSKDELIGNAPVISPAIELVGSLSTE